MRTIATLVDDDYYMRKVVRILLMTVGVCSLYEATDGLSGIEAIRSVAPDVLILDWEMPKLDGTDFMRVVRSPGSFPYPNVPVIMLSGHGQRSRVVNAVKVASTNSCSSRCR
jgi:two-component system chemotaxis response regulator CheY